MITASGLRPTEEERNLGDLGKILSMLLRGTLSEQQSLSKYIFQKPGSCRFKRDFEFTLGSADGTKLRCQEGAAVMFGGSGIVLPCVNALQELASFATIKYALKAPRPSEVQKIAQLDEAAESVEQARNEFIHHSPLSHKNIARLLDSETLEYPVGLFKASVKVLLVEWVEGATPLLKYLAETVLGWTSVVELLIEVFDGLQHLHDKGLVHWDIKSDNIRVDNAGVPKLMDIGNARPSATSGGKKAYSTAYNLPPCLFKKIVGGIASTYSSRKTPVLVGDSLEFDVPWLDLWMLARDLNRIVLADQGVLMLDSEQSNPNGDEFEQLGTQFRARLLDSPDGCGEYVLGYLKMVVSRLLYPLTPAAQQFYKSAKEVAWDLRKLLSEFGAAQSISELHSVAQQVLRVPISGNVPFPPRVRAFQDSHLVTRLRSHLQLGSAHRVFPGATHRRSEHLFGVMEAVTRFVVALYADKTSPFWRINMESEDIDALLFASLMHDIGHIAFGHELEEMEGLLRGKTHLDYALLLLQPDVQSISRWADTLSDDRTDLREIVENNWGKSSDEVDPFLNRVYEILSGRERGDSLSKSEVEKNSFRAGDERRPSRTEDRITRSQLLRRTTDRLKREVLHSLIDSAIDADKLDYLLRDAHHCGVQYPNGIDTDRFFQSLTTVMFQRDSSRDPEPILHACIGVSHKGLLPAESILVARYQMFSCVYWHHTHRSLSAMLQMSMQELLSVSRGRAEEELDEIINAFRSDSDHAALVWLKRRIAENNRFKEPTKAMLLDACAGLEGDRRFLYKEVFELAYQRPVNGSGDNQQNSVGLSSGLADIWDKVNSKTAPEYLREVRRIRTSISEKLSEALRLNVQFKEGEVLVDIPPSNRDQVEDVYVVSIDGAQPIQELSPIANAVSQAFQHWVRKTRIFLSPAAIDRLEGSGITLDRVREVTGGVLRQFASEESGKPILPFPHEDLQPKKTRRRRKK